MDLIGLKLNLIRSKLKNKFYSIRGVRYYKNITS